jgi:hypothetical protein
MIDYAVVLDQNRLVKNVKKVKMEKWMQDRGEGASDEGGGGHGPCVPTWNSDSASYGFQFHISKVKVGGWDFVGLVPTTIVPNFNLGLFVPP